MSLALGGTPGLENRVGTTERRYKIRPEMEYNQVILLERIRLMHLYKRAPKKFNNAPPRREHKLKETGLLRKRARGIQHDGGPDQEIRSTPSHPIHLGDLHQLRGGEDGTGCVPPHLSWARE